MEEEWNELDEYPNYMISNYGRVFSSCVNRILNPGYDSKGYLHIPLYTNRVGKFVSVHRLVAFAFVDGYFEGAVVNHIDGNKQNNVASNLEWITNGDNVRHAVALGLRSRKFRSDFHQYA